MKVLKLTTAVILTASLLAGCSTAPSSKESSSTAPGANAASSSAPTADSKKEKLEIKMMTNSFEGGGWPDKFSVLDELNKKLNIDLKVSWIPFDNYKEKLGVLAASNDFPDVYMIAGDDFLKWRDKGIFLDLQPMLEKYPNITKHLGADALRVENPKGKTYGLPYYVAETRDSLAIRKDWLDKLGLKLPTTVDEFYNVAKAFAKNDPDGNGKEDTVGLSLSIQNFVANGDSTLEEIKAAYGLANGWKDVNGTLVPWQSQSKELKDFLSFFRKAYEEGVLDKDFAVNKVKDPAFKFEAGKVGIGQVLPTTVFTQAIPAIKKVTPNAEVVQLSPPKGPTGLQGTLTSVPINKIVVNAKIDKKKQERIVEMLDYMLSDEGFTLIKNGIEGVHYKKTTDGKYEKLPEFDKERPYLLSFWLIRRFDPFISVRLWDSEEIKKQMEPWFNENAKYRNLNKGAGLFSETANKVGQSNDQKMIQAITAIIMGSKPIDSIDEAIAQWKKDGGDKIIEEINTEYKK